MIRTYLAALGLAIIACTGAYFLGAHRQHQADLDAGLAAMNAAALADAIRVHDIDLGTYRIDVAYHAAIAYTVAAQSTNVQGQKDAIDAEPSLSQCALPAALSRLRGEQTEAYNAILTAWPGQGHAGAAAGDAR